MTAARAFSLCVALLQLCVGCSDEVHATDTPVRPLDGGVDTAKQLVWERCDITIASGTISGGAECAEVTVPARRNVPNSRPVVLRVKRFKRVALPRAQLWLVAGGPGSAASDLEMDAETYLSLGSDLELYFLDHRGTGRSTRLACPVEEDPDSPSGELIHGSEWTTCAARLQDQWGDDLAGFSTTEAAADLGEMIDLVQATDRSVFVYAVSYGTYLAQRYLQLYPTQPTGVILDSICAPGKCDLLLEFDRQFDATARAIFDTCATDALCAAELGSEPFSHVISLSANLGNGHCAKLGWNSRTLRQILGFMVGIARLRDYMPAIVRRAERCNDSDIAALQTFQRYISGVDTEASSFSQALYANVALAELSMLPLPSPDAVANNLASLFASMDAGDRLAAAIDVWPIYPRDRYFGRFAETDVPMLMLNGTLDPETPLDVAQPAGDYYRRANQHFIPIPYSPHTTLTQSLIDEEGNTCGAVLARQFLANPAAELDTSCLAQVLPLDFAGFPDISRLLFGTDTAWTSPSATTP